MAFSLKSTIAARNNETSSYAVQYSIDGAKFQEWAVARIDRKGSEAHQAIGRLVAEINNSLRTVEDAERVFTSLLNK